MSESINPTERQDSVEEQMGILTQELELSIRWQRPCILMVAYDSEYVHVEAVSMLENFLTDCGQKIVRIHAGEPTAGSLKYWHEILVDTDSTIFLIDGLSDLAYQRSLKDILKGFDYLFAQKNARLVFWLTHKEASSLAYQSPALWVARNRCLELVAAPKPEQILQNALEAAWQGTGEYADEFDDPDAKSSVCESSLTELPKNNESTSIRANLLLTLGVLRWRKGDFENANEVLRNALKIAATMQDNWFEAECFNALALVKSSLGKNEEAIENYKQAIALAPGQIFAWNNLGNLCLKINRNHEAIIAFQKAIEHNSNDPIAWKGLGDVYSRSEYVDEAIAAYRKSIDLAPSLPHPWNGLGEIYTRNGKPNEAVAAFQKAIQLNKHYILPWLGLANLYTKQERYHEASKAYQQALLLDPRSSQIWNDLGCVYLEASRYEDAIEAFSKAIELDREFGWAYSNLGLANTRYEKIKESIPLYLKSLDLPLDEKQRNLTWNRLANSYRLVNDYGNAIKAYQNADSLNPGTHSPTPSNASKDPEPDASLKVETHLEADTSRLLESNAENPVDEQLSQPEPKTEEERPYWIFQPARPTEDIFQDSFFSIDAKLLNAVPPPKSTNKEIGGLSMQMTLPFVMFNENTTKPETFSPTELFEVSSTEVDQTSATAWNEKGNSLALAGAFEDAIQAYNRAIKLDHSFGWSYCNLGITYLHLGRYAEAILLLQKSVELLASDQERAIAWNELGNLYRSLNDYHNALAAYQKADELDPNHAGLRDTVESLHSEPNNDNVRLWNELGDTFFKGGSYHEASNCYRKIVEMEPFNGWAYNNLALSLTYQARFNEAVPLYLKSIDLFRDDKDKAEAWNRLGNVYRRLNDYDRAIKAYQNGMKLNNEKMTLLTRARFSLLGNCLVD
jgi:tetratricopeptide (TPR) repeat protein